jgi:hypothetical protein
MNNEAGADGVLVVVEGAAAEDDLSVVQQEFAYVATLTDMAHFVVLYGAQKVLSDLMPLATRLALKDQDRSYG